MVIKYSSNNMWVLFNVQRFPSSKDVAESFVMGEQAGSSAKVLWRWVIKKFMTSCAGLSLNGLIDTLPALNHLQGPTGQSGPESLLLPPRGIWNVDEFSRGMGRSLQLDSPRRWQDSRSRRNVFQEKVNEWVGKGNFPQDFHVVCNNDSID